jgi:Protein of unknown function (DUF1553)/Protein of unknown function (DUF1549)/Planctomycete cytochrome C
LQLSVEHDIPSLKGFAFGGLMKIYVFLVLVAFAAPIGAQTNDDVLFESKIRPVLAAKCYACHSAKLKAPMASLVLDTKAGLAQGGRSGAAVIPGKPAESRLLQALKYTDSQLQMPPTGKLPDSVLADFEAWIAAGAKDPRQDTPANATTPLKGMDIETGRKWWSFQPARELPAPKVDNSKWIKTKIDSFVLAKLEESKLPPSAPADARSLIRRAYLDLAGIAPTYEEVEAFANDKSPAAYGKLIDRLLASQQYGEQWGRHWLDVARFAEDNPTSEATNPPYPYAWRYRDWVIESMNKDMPYNRFVKMQLAADLMPGTTRQDWRALAYLGAAPIYHKEPRLSQEVIYTFATDDWDERVDAVGRGLLGISLGCARCHDHKFDPITTKDYYGLAGVFASTMRAERPLRQDVDPKVETRFLWVNQRLFDLNVIVGIVSDSAKQTNKEWAAKKQADLREEMKQLVAEMDSLKDRYPELYAQIQRVGAGRRQPPVAAAADVAVDATADPNAPEPPAAATGRGGAANAVAAQANRRGRGGVSSQEPFIDAVYDAAVYVSGKDPFMTELDIRPGEARDLPVFRGGSVANPGEMVPRHFPAVLAKGDPVFHNGSGRLELADMMFSDAAPLAARVIVNRVWAWHFGKPLVGTPSDFGTQGDKPTHPELLEDLTARFIANGWSLKWLHREMMLSSFYRQSSQSRPDGEQADQTNRLLWRMNSRRVDIEAYRDSILQSSGSLDKTMYGPSIDFDTDGNYRRTVYARISRGRTNTVLRLYDFPDPMQTSPGRDFTTTPLQQLFVMNSSFLQGQAAALAKGVENNPDNPTKVRNLYRAVLSRDPTGKEIDLALSYLVQATLAEYAQALLATNEVMFWP